MSDKKHIFRLMAVAVILFGCEPTDPAYDPETACTVDSARAVIICVDKP